MVIALVPLALAVVVLLLLLLLVSPAFREATRQIVGSVPLIGGWLASNTPALYAGLLYQVNRLVVADLNVLARALQWVADTANFNVREQLAFDQSVTTQLYSFRYKTLPAAQRQAEQYAAALAMTAEKYSLGLARFLVRYSQTLYGAAVLYARSGLLGLELWTAAQVARGLAYSQTLFGLGVAYTNQAYLAAVNRADADALTAEGYTQSVARILSAQAQDLFGQARDYTDAEARVLADFARKTGLQAEQHASLENAQTVAWAAAAVGAVAVAVRTIERSPCMQQCDTLGNLGAELSVLDLGAILALVEAAARDPQGTAGFIRAEVVPLVRDNARLVRGIV